MEDKAIFETLFTLALASKDPRGVVASALVRDGSVIAGAVSADDGIGHAENILLRDYTGDTEGALLYCTLEPCSLRSNPENQDCVSDIIKAGITEVVFGARDPSQSARTEERLAGAGIAIRQVGDPEIKKRCAEIFNDSVSEAYAWEVELKPLE